MAVYLGEDDDEVWSVVPGFSRYQVSNHGNLYDSLRKRFISTYLNNGYRATSLVNDRGIRKLQLVHRLVARAFVDGETSDRRWVNHIDGDKSNPHVDNLEWVTPAENISHAVRMGLINRTNHGKGFQKILDFHWKKYGITAEEYLTLPEEKRV